MRMDTVETLQTMVSTLARKGGRAALIVLRRDELESWTYAELADVVHRFAAGLRAQGLEQGDHAVLCAPNSAPWVVACLALLEIGAIPVPVDTQASREDLVHIVQDSGARWAFVTTALAPQLVQVQPAAGLQVILLDEEARDEPYHWRRFLTEGSAEFRATSPDDCAVLFYTSGTTGPPKGVPLTHRNLSSNIAALVALNIARADDRLLLPLPLHHVYPLVVGLLSPLALGVAIIIPYSLTGPHIQRSLREGRATAILGVPRLYSALCGAIEQRISAHGRIAWALFRAMLALSIVARRILGLNIGRWCFAPLRRRVAPDVRLVISGGAALEPPLAWKLEGLGWQVATGYGLTETSPILTFNLPGTRHFDNAGRPLPGVALRIDKSDPDAVLGEVLVKGPNVFSSYHHLPEPSAQAFTADGWFRTGDLGYVDDKGYLHLNGRASSMIVLAGGTNVNPEEVEAALERGRYIREAGVVERDGRLSAIIVPESSTVRELDPLGVEQVVRQDVLEQSRGLASYQQVGKVLVDRTPLPRTRLGKLRRYKLDRRYEQIRRTEFESRQPSGPLPIDALAPEDRELLEDPIARRVWAWLGERYRAQALSPDTSLRLDLDVDSIEWLGLALEIRDHIGVELGDSVIGRVETVRDLLRESIAAVYATEAAIEPEAQLREPQLLLDEEQRRWLKPSGAVARAFSRLLYAIFRPLMRWIFHLEVRGETHVPPAGPCIFTPNHQSLLDPLAVAVALGPRRLLYTFWGGWTGIMFNTALRRAFSRAVRVLPVDLGKGPLSNLAMGVTVLQQDCNLVWFPEGERFATGELHAFRTGVGLLAQASAAPIVPVWIEGSGQALPPGALWPRRRAISVTFGAALDVEHLERQGVGTQSHERITSALHSEVASLQPKAQPPASDSVGD